MDVPVFHPQPLGVPIGDSQLKSENDACVVPEVALVVVAFGESVSEPSENVIKLRRPDGNGFAQRDVNPSTNDEIKSIIARTYAGGAARAWIYT